MLFAKNWPDQNETEHQSLSSWSTSTTPRRCDELGHLFGDKWLKEVAHRLRSGLRAYESVGRYGGEEFLLVLPACDLAAALVRGEQIRAAVSDTPIKTSA